MDELIFNCRLPIADLPIANYRFYKSSFPFQSAIDDRQSAIS